MGIYIGVDPGKNGGLSVLGYAHPLTYPMPDTIRGLWDLIHEISHSASIESLPIKAYLESVSASPQMGVVSSFTFGNGFGHLEMALTAAGIPFERCRPQVWQREMSCLSKGDKTVTKRRAQELFPTLTITHAIADALLIAEYGRREEAKR